MADPRVTEVTTLSCSAAWRNYYFVKVTTADGTVGWSEFDEGFGSPGVGAVVQSLASRVIGQSAMQHERIREDLRGITRPGQGGVYRAEQLFAEPELGFHRSAAMCERRT